MNQLSISICGWQNVLIGLLVTPVFFLSAELFHPPQHGSNFIFPIQFPQYILFHQQQHTDSAKNLVTLNPREILSSHDDLLHSAMLNPEKPVDTIHKMHRIEQLQQRQESAIYGDLPDAKNENAFFDEDGNVMRPHGQPGNVLNRQFIDRNEAMFKKNPTAPTTVGTSGYSINVAKSMSFAEKFINNLATNNAAVNLSYSTSPNVLLPFAYQGTQYTLEGRTSENGNENNKQIRFLQHPYVIIINGPTRIYGAGTESKFPPFIEFFVQRIQKYFSVYKYEDLSRPPIQIPT